MTKVALIEFGNSHDEILYPQYLFLDKSLDFEPVLFVSEDLRSRLFSYPESKVFFIPSKMNWRNARQLHKKLEQLGIRKAVINTASGKKVRNFLWAKPFSSIRFFGVLHHLRKLENSSTQKLINIHLKGLFFLAEYLTDKARQIQPKREIGAFCAGFLPSSLADKSIQKPKGEYWIVIPGQVEYKRRDYLSLVNSLKGYDGSLALRFVLLGKSHHHFGDGPHLQKLLKELNLEGFFISWKDFVPNQEFYSYLSQADFVLPLIHHDHPGGQLYQKQISGAWNMAAAFHIPLLIEEGGPASDELADASISYLPGTLKTLWKELPSLKKGREFYQSSQWNLEQQADAYCDFLRSK